MGWAQKNLVILDCCELGAWQALFQSLGTPKQSCKIPGKYHRKCKNAQGQQPLTCKLSDKYRDFESKYPNVNCKAACDQASSCIAIGTHYHCDRLFFSDYDTALSEIPDDLCKEWQYTNTAVNSVHCNDIEKGDCGVHENTNGCYVKKVKSGKADDK